MSVFNYNAEACFEEIERLGDIAAQKRVMITIMNTEDSRQVIVYPTGKRSEQKKAKWIPIYYDNKAMFYQCPYCGARYMLQTRFCGNCGEVVCHE